MEVGRHTGFFDRSRIEPSTTEEALAACGPALVGRGSYLAEIAFPDQEPFASRGRIVAFNARTRDGGEAILAHVYSAEPITRIIVFRISRRLRRPAGFPRRPLPLRPSRDALRRRPQNRLDPDPQLPSAGEGAMSAGSRAREASVGASGPRPAESPERDPDCRSLGAVSGSD